MRRRKRKTVYLLISHVDYDTNREKHILYSLMKRYRVLYCRDCKNIEERREMIERADMIAYLPSLPEDIVRDLEYAYSKKKPIYRIEEDR